MPASYRVVRAPKAVEQIKTLFSKAPTSLARVSFVDSLRHLLTRLQTAPAELGEPVRNTRLPGGVVHVAVLAPFVLQFVLYDSARFVLLFDVRPVPRSYID